jgi:hypothetical protein
VLCGLVCACIGVGVLVWSTSVLGVLVSGVLYGAGSGMTQSASFVGMLERAAAGEVRLVGTLWNMAFDGGVSLGGAALGLVAALGGYSSVLLGLPLLTFLALLTFALAWHEPVRPKVSTSP